MTDCLVRTEEEIPEEQIARFNIAVRRLEAIGKGINVPDVSEINSLALERLIQEAWDEILSRKLFATADQIISYLTTHKALRLKMIAAEDQS